MPGTIATPLVPQLPVAGVYTLIVTPQSVDSSGNYTDTSPSVAVSTLVTNLDINIQNELTSIKPMTQTLENNVKTGQANTFSFSGIVTALQTGISMSALTYTVSYVKIVLVQVLKRSRCPSASSTVTPSPTQSRASSSPRHSALAALLGREPNAESELRIRQST